MSAILSADDLNDFISPGVACIKPVETLPSTADDNNTETLPHSQLELEVVLDGTPGAASSSFANKSAQISLTDCLACSGCVTSAEAVLISLQSHTEVLSVLDAAPGLRISPIPSIQAPLGQDAKSASVTVKGLDNPDSKILVASVAPQVLASLAAVLNVSAQEAEIKLNNFLRSTLAQGGKYNNAFTYVVSTEPANDLSLHLSALEVLSSPSPCFKNDSSDPAKTNSKKLKSDSGSSPFSIVVEGAQKKPLLASSCPGWVCYAEKTHPHVLPHLSRVKSPQALTGVLLKSILAKKLGVGPERIWHLSVMPCFDKKLEAAREELTSLSWMASDRNGNDDSGPEKGVRDVDCVITSKEIFLLAQERELDFFTIPTDPISITPRIPFPDEKMASFLSLSNFSSTKPTLRKQHPREEGSSGGILHHILCRSTAMHPGSRIEATRGRNVDVVEYAVVTESRETVFKAARYYGFRNIQNLVRRLKPARQSRLPGARTVGTSARRLGNRGTTKLATGGSDIEYGYIEVMACPGGCTNGGGQMKVDDRIVAERHELGEKPGVEEQKAWLTVVDGAYFSSSEGGSIPDVSGSEMGQYDDVLGSISPSYVQGVLDYWSGTIGVDLERLVNTSYREVVSDVGKEVSEAERVVQLAGKIGGGW